jgi:hypothetical protein
MRKWLGIGAILLVGAAGAFWHFHVATRPHGIEPLPNWQPQGPVTAEPKELPEHELCNNFEPLVVEGSTLPPVPCEPGMEFPMLRVVLAPGMEQPPRPDAESGTVLRMPYADEEVVFKVATKEDIDILNSQGPIRGSAFHGSYSTTSKQSKPMNVTPPQPETLPIPESDPAMDYHRQHCPRCSFPYYGK